MRKLHVGQSISMMFGALAFMVAGISFGQTTYTVNQTPGMGDFTSIAPAMLVATDGDTVEVTDNSVYEERVEFAGEDIALICDPLDRATIQPPPGGTTQFLIDMSGGLTRAGLLSGFRIQLATNGAIDCSGSSPTILANEISGNTLPAGDFNSAGITGVDSSPLIQRNIFDNNYVFQNGGAIYLEGQSTVAGAPFTAILDNYFSNNFADDAALTPFDRKGGAIYAVGNDEGSALDRILIQRNDFYQNAARGYGGAIALEGRSATIADNDFTQNLMLFQVDDFYPCGSPISYGGGAVSIVDSNDNVSFLLRNTYLQNWSDYDGGAVYLWNSLARLGEEDIEGSLATCQGGGVFSGEGSVSIISLSDISNDNIAGDGGGVAYVNAGPSFLIESEISRNGATVSGAGVYSENSDPVLNDLLLDSNGEDLFVGTFRQAPPNGGGIAIRGGSATIERCEIIRNAALGDGGGIFADDVDTDLTVLNCILGANIVLDDVKLLVPSQGAAMYVNYAVGGTVTPFASNTVARNRAESTGFAGVYVESANFMEVVNGIVWNNRNGYDFASGTATGPNQTLFNASLGAGGFAVDYTDIVNNGTFVPGPNNISAIPRFVDIPNANFRIRWNSPCINQGDNGAALISGGDIDNQTRILNLIIDMGADEVLVPQDAGGGEPAGG